MQRLSDFAYNDNSVVDCDIHPEIPNTEALLPYVRGHFQDMLLQQGLTDFESYNYPPKTPLRVRPDWKPAAGKPAVSVSTVKAQLLDPFRLGIAICNPLLGLQLLPSEDLATVLASALNDYMAEEWLAKDARLRASIVVASQNPSRAAEEIERVAADKRFVQIILLVSNDMPLGKRFYWPIYEAAHRLGLPVSVHAGSTFRHPLTPAGSTATYYESYASQASAFQAQLMSLVTEGVFSKFPGLRVVLSESGVTWLPATLNRIDKFWHGLRIEVPWIQRLPSEIVRENVRFTLQPFDAPDDALTVSRIVDQFESDEIILFSTDYPHWQFDEDAAIPTGFDAKLFEKIAIENPRKTYGRIA